MPADDNSLDLIFRKARTHHGWQEKSIDDALLKQVYDLAKWGPTSANCCPMRLVFVKSREAKEKLKPCLDKGNVEQTMSAPTTAIIGYDMEFYKKMDKLWPQSGGKMFEKTPEDALKVVALRNGSLQGAYFILAARALGLDCGPMSGFNNAKLDEAFFAGTAIKSNFLCNLGYGDPSKLYPRGPRLDFDEACRIE
jgi:3-hydroxypropanoate dehydrogenase